MTTRRKCPPPHFFTCRVIALPPAWREDHSTARKRPLIGSVISKSGNRFSEKIMLNQKLEWDADSPETHPAP
jgi:hypothetical protein